MIGRSRLGCFECAQFGDVVRLLQGHIVRTGLVLSSRNEEERRGSFLIRSLFCTAGPRREGDC